MSVQSRTVTSHNVFDHLVELLAHDHRRSRGYTGGGRRGLSLLFLALLVLFLGVVGLHLLVGLLLLFLLLCFGLLRLLLIWL